MTPETGVKRYEIGLRYSLEDLPGNEQCEECGLSMIPGTYEY